MKLSKRSGCNNYDCITFHSVPSAALPVFFVLCLKFASSNLERSKDSFPSNGAAFSQLSRSPTRKGRRLYIYTYRHIKHLGHRFTYL